MMNNTFTQLEFDKILEMLAGYAFSEKIKQRLLNLRPYINEAQLIAHIEKTTQAKRILEISGNPPLLKKRTSNTKKYGMRKATNPYFTAMTAIRIGGSREIAAAANAASATGGVIDDSMAE